MTEYKRILRRNWKLALGLSLLMILSAAADVAAGYSLGWIMDAYEAGGDRVRALLIAVAQCLGLFMLAIAIDYIRDVSQFRAEHIFKNDLRGMVARKFSALSSGQRFDRDSGAYVSWLSNDVDALYEKSIKALFDGVRFGFGAAFAFFVMSAGCWYIGAIAISLFALGVAVPQLFSKRLERAAAQRSAALEASMEAYKDAIMGAGVLSLSGLRGRIVERIAASSDRAEREIFQSNRSTRRATIVLGVLNLFSQIALIAAAIYAAITGAAPLGVAMYVGNLCGTFFNGVRDLMNGVMAIRSTKPLWEKFAPDEVRAESGAALSPIGTIAFESVSFSYGEREILKNRSLTFRTDGKYAILGESGSGKTTILKLLLGLLPGYEGRILYDGTEQREADLATLYDQVAYVDQQVYLFQDTLRFNITLGQPYSDSEIMAAVRAARLEDFVESLPDGLDSVIRENGKNLSGGQRQRIALARGLIRRARLIILDEGTSALDEENAMDVEQNLMDSPPGVILITHNLRDEIRTRLTGVYEM